LTGQSSILDFASWARKDFAAYLLISEALLGQPIPRLKLWSLAIADFRWVIDPPPSWSASGGALPFLGVSGRSSFTCLETEGCLKAYFGRFN
jgi:hypothetical protein